MKITKHAQSCFLVETNQSKVLIDLGTYVFENENLSAKDFTDIDIIPVTHIHSDHFDLPNIKEIIRRDNPVILTNPEVVNELKKEGLGNNVKILNSLKEEKIKDVIISGLVSEHGPLPNGNPAPFVSGVLINDGHTKFYHPGDTISLDKNSQADIIAVPFSGTVTMNIEQAKEQLILLKPKLVIPMHYDSPRYPTPPSEFVKAMQGTGIEVVILENGQSIEKI